MNVDEASATECCHHAALPHSPKHCSESENVPGVSDLLSVATADQPRGAVEAGPDQPPASSYLRHTQHRTEMLGADHEQHASESHGDEAMAMASALEPELALNVGSLTLSKTYEDRSSPDRCPIVDAQDMDSTGLQDMDAETNLHSHQNCAATDMPDKQAKAYKHGLQDTTAAAAGPPMATDTEHMPTAAVTDFDAATAHADEMEVGTCHCSSWGLQVAQHPLEEAAQVTWLVSRTQLSVLSILTMHSIIGCYGDP